MPGLMQKVKRGDPLVIPAATFNTFIDAARDFQDRQRNAGGDPRREQRDTGIVLVRNDTGADRARFDVLGIDGPIFKPLDNADEFKGRVALRGGIPAAPHRGRFVVLLSPCKDRDIVHACVDGVCPVRVRIRDESHEYADVQAGVASELETVTAGLVGAARILWVEPPEDRTVPDLAWALVRLGVSSASPGWYRVRLRVDGGVNGSPAAPPTWTYSVFAAEDQAMATALATGLSPAWRLTTKGYYQAPADGEFGIVFYDGGTWSLWLAPERLVAGEGCAQEPPP